MRLYVETAASHQPAHMPVITSSIAEIAEAVSTDAIDSHEDVVLAYHRELYRPEVAASARLYLVRVLIETLAGVCGLNETPPDSAGVEPGSAGPSPQGSSAGPPRGSSAGPQSSPQGFEELKVTVKTAAGLIITLNAKASDTIDTVKARIQDKEGIPPEQQCLVSTGKQMENGRTLRDYNVEPDDETLREAIVWLGPRPTGGMALIDQVGALLEYPGPEEAPPEVIAGAPEWYEKVQGLCARHQQPRHAPCEEQTAAHPAWAREAGDRRTDEASAELHRRSQPVAQPELATLTRRRSARSCVG